MKNFKYILFDLDGTLLDSGEGIINSVKYALEKYNKIETDEKILKSFVGPPLIQRFEECYNFSETKSRQALIYFREYYERKGIFENKIYEDIPWLLYKLKSMGKKIMVATSKPEVLAYKILSQHNLVDCFDFIGGSLMDETRSTKSEVLRYVLESNDLFDVKNNDLVMIGDTKYDIIGAKEYNIAAIGVTYGYGNKEDLIKAGADIIVNSPKEILDNLL